MHVFLHFIAEFSVVSKHLENTEKDRQKIQWCQLKIKLELFKLSRHLYYLQRKKEYMKQPNPNYSSIKGKQVQRFMFIS